VEVHKLRSGPVQADDDLTDIDKFLMNSFTDWVEVDLLLAIEARKLARKHGLNPGDAVHLAAAIRAGCDYLVRWDRPWAAGNYSGVEVCEPFWFGQSTLYLPGPGLEAPSK
jgi:predicted nucleic acid-binding protein